MNTTAHQRVQLDAAENSQETNSKSFDHFLPYRSLDRSILQTTPETPMMAAFKGDNDVSIVDGASDTKPTSAGYDTTAGVQALEELKERHGYTDNGDGSYTLKGENGQNYTVRTDDKGFITGVVDSNGQAVTDKTTNQQIIETLREIKAKEGLLEYVEGHPLETDKQKDAYDRMFEAMKNGDFKAMGDVAKEFAGNPEEFDAVFAHLFAASKMMPEFQNVELLLLASNKGDRMFLAGNDRPEVSVPITK